MPYLYVHTQFGTDVLDRLDAPLQARIGRDKHAFLLGLLGPDIYFFDRLPPPLLRKHEKRTGNAIHNAPANEVFAALLPMASENAVYAAYTLGFLCHYALDGAAHPFVESAHRGVDHTRFEMELELPFLEKRGTKPLIAPHKIYGAAMRDAALTSAIDRLHVCLTEKLFQRSVALVYPRSCKNFLLVHRILFDPKGKLQKVLCFFERLFSQPDGTISRFLLAPYNPTRGDIFNETHTLWHAHWAADIPRTESFFDLYEAAIAEATALLPLSAAAIDGDVAARDILLNRLKGGSMARGKTKRETPV